jgi:hypothetical protein
VSARVERVVLQTADGLALEGERARPAATSRAGCVLCHPHPRYGGTMRSLVVSALFDALPARGVDCLRFNFRGVEGSAGAYDDGRGERHDVVAAVDLLACDLPAAVPLALAGWSFGADMALATHDPRIAGWAAIALPMRFVAGADLAPVAADARPKLLVLAARDEFRAASWVVEQTATWSATTTELVEGASHFFVGRTDRVVELVAAFVERLG